MTTEIAVTSHVLLPDRPRVRRDVSILRKRLLAFIPSSQNASPSAGEGEPRLAARLRERPHEILLSEVAGWINCRADDYRFHTYLCAHR
jgi:hypothetical protein